MKSFTMQFPDPTAEGGQAKFKFDPTFDRVPSTGQLVTTRELGTQYWKEVCRPKQMTPEFLKYPKMARFSRDVVVTEKIDGTNAQIYIERVNATLADTYPDNFVLADKNDGDTNLIIRAGSRSRYLTRQTDNHGFAKWVQEQAGELFGLGEGRHFGEWWGSGIQRGYGLPKGEKRFSLFNVQRWLSQHDDGKRFACLCANEEFAPACCHVVPILWTGPFDDREAIQHSLDKLARFGSRAAKGFMDPEGIVVYHMAGNVGFKKTVKNDEKPKSHIVLEPKGVDPQTPVDVERDMQMRAGGPRDDRLPQPWRRMA